MDKHSFHLMVLGCSGGPYDSNLSCYLLGLKGTSEYIAFDAGTLLSGLKTMNEKKRLPTTQGSTLCPEGAFFLHNLKAYLISHPHLDHIAGLIINSQADGRKAILGIDATIDILRDHIFNGKVWPNYGSEGPDPINRYQYLRLKTGINTAIPDTSMHVEAFPLAHPDKHQSSAFLIEAKGAYILYFGDTSPDAFSKSKCLEVIWKRCAPLLKANSLKAILLECSYPMKESRQIIYGHLDPKTLLEELSNFSTLAGASLKDFPLIVTHRKDSLHKNENAPDLIASELRSQDSLGIQWIFPSQADSLFL